MVNIEVIDFSFYERNFKTQTEARRLSQFGDACVMAGVLSTEVTQSQEWYDAIQGTLSGRTLAEAIGVQLDILGVLVGQDRVLIDQAIIDWFEYDNNANHGYDITPYWVTNAPFFGNLPATDVQYRQLIVAKIFKNHVQGGTIPEILRSAQLLFDINISVVKNGLNDLTLLAPAGLPVTVYAALLSQVSDKNADHQYLLPVPATFRLLGLTPVFPETFGYDGGLNIVGYDEGEYSITIPANNNVDRG